jgi:hypothetical protein
VDEYDRVALLTDILPSYPYFQGSSINDAANVFWKSVQDTKSAVDRVSPGKWVWVTETGWPVSGANFGAGVASVKNARKLKHTQSVQISRFANSSHRDLLARGCLQGIPAGPLLLLRVPRLHCLTRQYPRCKIFLHDR